jgi:hypothetical protein
VASKPPKFRNVEIRSRLEGKSDKQFQAGDFIEEIVLTNHNWPNCIVVVELKAQWRSGIRINGKRSWKSGELYLLGGKSKPEKRTATIRPTLKLKRPRRGGDGTLIIKVKWRREAVAEFTEICELTYPICVQ